MKRCVVYGVVAVLAAATSGAAFYTHRQSERAAAAEEAAARTARHVWLFCDGQQRDELYELWHWVSELSRRGAPPGVGLAPVTTARMNVTRLGDLCGSRDEYARQLGYVTFLVETDQWNQAAKRLYELRNQPEHTWSALEIVMPPEPLPDVALIGAAHFAGARPMPSFELSAWSRWHPTGTDDPPAIAFTLIRGAATSWQIAIGSRRDLFPIGKVDDATAAAIVAQLAAVGLHVPPPEPGVPLLEWAWSAPYAEFERLARDAEAADLTTDRQEPLASLVQRPYDYRRFRGLLDRVRPP